jgi:hypothetical protein
VNRTRGDRRRTGRQDDPIGGSARVAQDAVTPPPSVEKTNRELGDAVYEIQAVIKFCLNDPATDPHRASSSSVRCIRANDERRATL